MSKVERSTDTGSRNKPYVLRDNPNCEEHYATDNEQRDENRSETDRKSVHQSPRDDEYCKDSARECGEHARVRDNTKRSRARAQHQTPEVAEQGPRRVSGARSSFGAKVDLDDTVLAYHPVKSNIKVDAAPCIRGNASADFAKHQSEARELSHLITEQNLAQYAFRKR